MRIWASLGAVILPTTEGAGGRVGGASRSGI